MTDYKPSAPPTGPEEGSSDPLNPLNPLNPPPPQISPPPYPGLDGHSPPPPPLGFTIHPNPSAYSTPPPSYQPVPLYLPSPHLYPHPHPYQPTTTTTTTQFVVHAGRQPGTVVELPKLFALKKYFLVGALLFSLVFTFFELSTAREVVRLRFAYSDKKDVEYTALLYQTMLAASCLYNLVMLAAILRHQLCLVTTFVCIQILFAVAMVYSYFVWNGGFGLPYTLFSVVIAAVALLFVRDLRAVVDGKRFRRADWGGTV